MSSPKHYTVKDIERYHRGDMTAAERHHLEKAALDDPMLADALEGFAYTTTGTGDLQALQKRLGQRLEEKKERNVFFMGPRWLKIAALFLLLAGGGWLVLQTYPGNKAELVSSNAEREEILSRDRATDSVSTVQTIPPVLFTDTLQRSNEVVVSGTQKSKAPPPSPAATSSAPLSAMSDAAKENKTETGATQTESSDKAATSEIVSLQSSAPANTGREAVDTARHADVAQQKSADRVNEAASKRRVQPTRAKATLAEEAEPEGGWPAFERYLAANKKPVNTATEGIVELQFDIDKNRKPVNIRVAKPLCESCDREAIRLLKEGPDWQGKKGNVKITF